MGFIFFSIMYYTHLLPKYILLDYVYVYNNYNYQLQIIFHNIIFLGIEKILST